VGWKTLRDAKATAEQAPREAATAQVKLLMQKPEIQKIARDAAAQVFQNGAKNHQEVYATGSENARPSRSDGTKISECRAS
jgi:hypothetical protein